MEHNVTIALTAVDQMREKGCDEDGLKLAAAFDKWWLDPLIVENVGGLDCATFPSEDARGWVHNRVRVIALCAWFQAITEMGSVSK